MGLEEKYSVMMRYEWNRRGHLASGDGRKGSGSQVDFVRDEDKAEFSRQQISSILLLVQVDFLPQIR